MDNIRINNIYDDTQIHYGGAYMDKNLETQITYAVKKTGEFLKDHAFDYGELTWKTPGEDPVTVLDCLAEEKFKEESSPFIKANYLGEENGLVDNNSQYTLIIDPIDGTKSFARREFNSCLSVGLEENGELKAGWIYDFMKSLMYVGFGEETYFLYDGKKEPFPKRLVTNKIKLDLDDGNAEQMAAFKQYKNIEHITRGGSIALTMAQVACNALDGMIAFDKTNGSGKGKGNIWDVAGAYHLLKARNYVVLDGNGKPFDYKKPDKGITALRPDIADLILDIAFPDRNLPPKKDCSNCDKGLCGTFNGCCKFNFLKK